MGGTAPAARHIPVTVHSVPGDLFAGGNPDIKRSVGGGHDPNSCFGITLAFLHSSRKS